MIQKGFKRADRYIVLDIETTGLNPIQHRITHVCAKSNNNNKFSYTHIDEEKILLEFEHWIRQQINDYRNGTICIVTKNGLCFDLPFILSRGVKHGVFLGIMYTLDQFDLHTITARWIKLSEMASILNIPFTKNGDGLKAIELWQKNELAELKRYCENDVELTEQCYLAVTEPTKEKR